MQSVHENGNLKNGRPDRHLNPNWDQSAHRQSRAETEGVKSSPRERAEHPRERQLNGSVLIGIEGVNDCRENARDKRLVWRSKNMGIKAERECNSV